MVKEIEDARRNNTKRKLLKVHSSGKDEVTVESVPVEAGSVKGSDCFVLATYDKIYQFNGAGSGAWEKRKALNITRRIVDVERKGVGNVKIINCDEGGPFAVRFWAELGVKVEPPRLNAFNANSAARHAQPRGRFERVKVEPQSSRATETVAESSIVGDIHSHQHALTDHAFEGAGAAAGVEIWRIEHFLVKKKENKPDPKDTPRNVGMLAHVGTFYSGDSYIILHTNEKLQHKIHFLRGKEASQNEYTTMA